MAIRNKVGNSPPKLFFDNIKKFLRPQEVADMFDMSLQTIYDWKYRPHVRNTPDGLFIKFNGQVYLQTEILVAWVSNQNS